MENSKDNSERVLILKNPPIKWETIWGDGSLVKKFNWEVANGTDINRVSGGIGFGAEQFIVNGSYSGHDLKWLYENHPDYFGLAEERRWEIIPISQGVGHAAENLSVQVHPREDWALENLHMHGKSECWYIIDCPPGANVVMGHNAKTMEELDDFIAREDWEGLVKRYPIEPGSFYAIKAGTLHALQKGTTFIETCNPCPVTYRFYDYDRVDQDGKPRELNIEKAKENILIPFEQIVYDETIMDYGDVKETFLADNEDYSTWLYEVNGKGLVPRKKPFCGCFVFEGEGTVNGLPIKQGTGFLITRYADDFVLEGKMKILACHG